MTLRERVLHVVRGGRAEVVPFTCYLGLVPEGGLSIPNLALVTSAPVCRTVSLGVEYSSRDLSPGVRENRMKTPWGTLTQVTQTEPGYGSSWIKEHWVKAPEDYAVLEQMIRHTSVVADPEPLRKAREQVGHRGVVLAWTSRAPFQRLWIEYTGIERLSYDLHDAPAAVEGVLDAFAEQSREILKIAAASEAELVWIPDNITGAVTGPRLFERYLAPYYRQVCDLLLPCGKTPVTHMDGLLQSIAECVALTDLPVIEAFTPPPDGNLSVREARKLWPRKTLWLNFPSSLHLSPPEAIKRATKQLVQEAGDGGGFLIGITENIPAEVATRSLEAIAEALQ
jgi:hypothetical protein